MLETLSTLLLITLIPAVATLPNLRYLGSGKHLIENPLKETVEMTVNCGTDYEKLKFNMLPRTREYFTVKDPDGNFTVCFEETWHRVP